MNAPRLPIALFSGLPAFALPTLAAGAPAPPGSPGSTWAPFARGTIPPQFTARIGAGQFSSDQGFR